MKKISIAVLSFLFGRYFNFLAIFSKKRAAKQAFYLFCTPRKGKIAVSQKEFLATAKSNTVTIENHIIQVYEWWGTGATVLLVHGWESNSWRWHKLIQTLQQKKHRIIAFDAPAHGGSEGPIFNVPLYASCIDFMSSKYRPKHIIGHSIGGMSLLYHQYKFSDNSIEKLVTIAAPSELSIFMEQYQRMLRLSNTVMEALDSYFRNHFGFHIEEFKTFLFVRSLSKPGLILHDKEDKIAHISASQKVHKNWDNSTFIMTKGLGHSMHQDQVNSKILAFLNS